LSSGSGLEADDRVRRGLGISAARRGRHTQIRLGGVGLSQTAKCGATSTPPRCRSAFLIVLNPHCTDGVMLGYFRNRRRDGPFGARLAYEGLTLARWPSPPC
jgi:hypothetical protein